MPCRHFAMRATAAVNRVKCTNAGDADRAAVCTDTRHKGRA
eukprot:COSAG06_NODE_176_length_21031_cov_66.751290_17_plen_41_part_00